MNRTEFISKLNKCLKSLGENERKEIVSDYEEHFDAGISLGKSEEEIALQLGDPCALGKMYMADSAVKRAENEKSFANLLSLAAAIISLSIFNLIFFIPVFAAVIGVAVGVLGGIVGILAAGVGVTIISILHPVINLEFINSANLIAADWAALFFLGVSVTSFGVFFSVIYLKGIKLLWILLIRYLKFNIKIIKKDGGNDE